MKRIALGLWVLLGAVACSSGVRDSSVGAATVSLEQQTALAYLQRHKMRFQLDDPQQQLTLLRQKRDLLGFQHLSFQQMQNGVPVWRAVLRVHINRAGEVYRVTGKGVAGLTAVATEPQLGVDEVAQYAVALMPAGLNVWKVTSAKLYVYAPWQNGKKLVYQVELHRGLIRQFLLLDADDGRLIKRIAGTPSIY
ncbi:MAG: hypothetical protein Q9O24_12935 [Gammaproteobacteria bacterium]|nr:hypothetical protein [Gammaproteobacteria bacterium]